MIKTRKVNSCKSIENVEELKKLVSYNGKPLGPIIPSLFHIYELKKSHPTLFGSLVPSKNLEKRLSSNQWKKKLSFNFNIIYPNRETKLRFESIPCDEFITNSCATISKKRKLPLYLVIEFKSLLLYIPQWETCGLLRLGNTKIDFRELERTCRSSCREWQNNLVNCIPPSGY